MDAGPFALNPALDPDALAQAFAAAGRISIPDFLEAAGAEALREHLLGRGDWVEVLNAGEQVYEIPRNAPLDPDQQHMLDRLVAREAQSGFQYRYETLRVSDLATERAQAGTLLDRFAELMSSEPALAFFRRVTGFADLVFADAQATAYGPGHFLTRHDDDVGGKGRRAAYVLGLTPEWRAEWGGLLMFHRADGDIEQAFTPGFNVLRLFAVPAQHSVSYVAPFAPEPRLSVTGWLRRRG